MDFISCKIGGKMLCLFSNKSAGVYKCMNKKFKNECGRILGRLSLSKLHSTEKNCFFLKKKNLRCWEQINTKINTNTEELRLRHH